MLSWIFPCDLDAFHLSGLGELEASFLGLHPRALTLELADLRLGSLRVGNRKA